jgi:hypothetical protein
MKATCPHCGKDIEVVTSKELDSEFGLNTNRQQHLRSQGKMPAPWMEFPNRNIYLRADIEAMRASEAMTNASKMAETLEEQLKHLSESERKATLDMLKKLAES